LARKGLGESQFRRRDIHCSTLYIYVLCDIDTLGGRGVRKVRQLEAPVDAGGIHSLESILGIHKRLKIWALRSNPGQLRLWHCQSEAPTTQLDLIHTRLDRIRNSARSHPHSARSHPFPIVEIFIR
jgi:hypothetical protein